MTGSTDVHREAWVGRARDADLLEQAARCGAVLKRAGREHTGPCPWCGGKDRFSINPVKSKWHCRGHGGGGDAIGMVMHIAGLSFIEAVQDITGEPPPSGSLKPLSDAEKAERKRQRQESEARQQERKAQEQAYQADTREAAQAIWDASQPLLNTAGCAFLAKRHFDVEMICDVARYHPALRHSSGICLPAIVCRVDDVMGELIGIWREFVTADGEKARIDPQKAALGPVGGGAVRIGGIADHIGLAEGFRTALGAWHLIGKRYPVWATMSTSGLIGFEVPLAVRRVTLFPDGDRAIRKNGSEYIPAEPPGRAAVRRKHELLLDGGIPSSIAAEPPPLVDFENIWVEAAVEEDR